MSDADVGYVVQQQILVLQIILLLRLCNLHNGIQWNNVTNDASILRRHSENTLHITIPCCHSEINMP